MKPIFEEERLLLAELLNVDIPRFCWRKGHAIYLDINSSQPLYRFKVEDGKARITRNNSKTKFIKDYKQKTWKELVSDNQAHLDELQNNTMLRLRDYILNNPQVYIYALGYSSGKDSTINLVIWLETLKKYPEIKSFLHDNNIKWEIQMCNTSNDTAETYLNVKHTVPKILQHYGYGSNLVGYKGEKLLYKKSVVEADNNIDIVILNPEVGFYDWIIHEKDYFIPTVLVRNCCSTYKEGQTTIFYPRDKNVVIVTGVRKHESHKRKNYKMVMDEEFRKERFKTSNYPNKWVQLAPVIEWTNEDVWLYLLKKQTPINPMYKMGFHRVGCLMCPFQSNYIDIVIKKHYPKQYNRWMDIVRKNYETKAVKERLKWTLEEYQHGRWKQGLSKVYAITQLKKTPERVKQISDILGVSEEVASKYFNKKCKVCNKKLNPHEVGMFLKTQGVYEGVKDEREYLCKKHLSELLGISNKEYVELRKQFIHSDCNLF